MPKYFILYKRRKNSPCTLRLHAFITASQSRARGTDCRDNLTLFKGPKTIEVCRITANMMSKLGLLFDRVNKVTEQCIVQTEPNS